MDKSGSNIQIHKQPLNEHGDSNPANISLIKPHNNDKKPNCEFAGEELEFPPPHPLPPENIQIIHLPVRYAFQIFVL